MTLGGNDISDELERSRSANGITAWSFLTLLTYFYLAEWEPCDANATKCSQTAVSELLVCNQAFNVSNLLHKSSLPDFPICYTGRNFPTSRRPSVRLPSFQASQLPNHLDLLHQQKLPDFPASDFPIYCIHGVFPSSRLPNFSAFKSSRPTAPAQASSFPTSRSTVPTASVHTKSTTRAKTSRLHIFQASPASQLPDLLYRPCLPNFPVSNPLHRPKLPVFPASKLPNFPMYYPSLVFLIYYTGPSFQASQLPNLPELTNSPAVINKIETYLFIQEINLLITVLWTLLIFELTYLWFYLF